MVNKTGTLDIRVRERFVKIEIQIVPWQSNVTEQLEERWTESDDFVSFTYDLTRRFTEDGRVLPTVQSTLGHEIPVRSRELWRVPSMPISDLVSLIHSIRPLKSPVKHGVKEYSCEALVSFFENGHFDSVLKLFSVRPSCLEFVPKGEGSSLPNSIIDEFIEFGAREFKSYTSPKLRRQSRRDYVETNSIALGYLAQEESH